MLGKHSTVSRLVNETQQWLCSCVVRWKSEGDGESSQYVAWLRGKVVDVSVILW